MYRTNSKPFMERIVPARKTYDYSYPRDLDARGNAWGVKTRIISGGAVTFGASIRHDRLNLLCILVQFLFWTLSIRVIHPDYSSRTGYATYGD